MKLNKNLIAPSALGGRITSVEGVVSWFLIVGYIFTISLMRTPSERMGVGSSVWTLASTDCWERS
ncbi:MAG TPA: hypothetical protein VMW26_04705 [Methanomassiliicoccales archaeon]|nr:hypothetical protein [Methanomassiliicoccales archaeon]